MSDDISKQVEEYLARGGKMTIVPPGVSSEFPTERQAKDTNARNRANAKEKSLYQCKHNRMNGKAKTGHMNIVELKTCYTFTLNGLVVKTIYFGDDKAQALKDIVEFRDKHRKALGYPHANY